MHRLTRAASSAALALTLLTTASAGCGPARESARTAEPGSDSERAGFLPCPVEPPLVEDCSGEYGGTLSWSILGELATFNPLIENSVSGADLAPLVFDTLVTFDYDKWETGPLLASSWEESDDHLTYTFHLRHGVRFSDGEPFDADDVLFSFRAMFHPKVENSTKSLFGTGKDGYPDIEKLDDSTVRMTLKRPDVMFLSSVGSLQMFPEHVLRDTLDPDNPTFAETMKAGSDDLRKTVVGTGPFMPVQYKGGEIIRYERNPYSWKVDKDGRRLPYLDGVIVKILRDTNTQTEQFLSGGFDLLNSVQPSDIVRFRQQEKDGGKFEMHRLGVSLATSWLVLNLDPKIDQKTGAPVVAPYKAKLFDDVRFRRALSHAVDRKTLIKLFLDNKGEPQFGQTSSGNKAWYSEHTTYPYDPAKAKALLAEMGLADKDGDGFLEDGEGNVVEVELQTNVENETRVKVINRIKEDWTAVGIRAVAHPVDFNQLVDALQDGRRFDCILLGWGSGVPPDPLMSRNILLSSSRLHCWYPLQEKPANAWEAENDRLVHEMEGEFDLEKRKAIWSQILEHHATYLPQIYLFSPIQYAASSKRVRNVRPSLLRPETHHNVEQLWIDEK